MPYISSEVAAQVKHMDLLTYLHNYEPQELLRFFGNVYCTHTHDSLKIIMGNCVGTVRKLLADRR